MEEFFVGYLGVDKTIFYWFLLPLVVFCARVTDVSLSTLRVMFVASGRRNIAPFLGFCEAMIWILMIGQIMKNLGNVLTYFGYAGGFATGTFVGMYIESRLALGKVIVRIITKKEAKNLIDALTTSKFGFTNIQAEGKYGDVNVIFSVLKRQDLPQLLALIDQYHPNAFYTIENVRHVRDLKNL
jgi:uncharacterized protein YebE (UPF0316 family)